jgi:hypothetical protein
LRKTSEVCCGSHLHLRNGGKKASPENQKGDVMKKPSGLSAGVERLLLGACLLLTVRRVVALKRKEPGQLSGSFLFFLVIHTRLHGAGIPKKPVKKIIC